MELILCIESSGSKCSCCVIAGSAIKTSSRSESNFSHTSELTLMIDRCTKEAGLTFDQLNAIAISGGPGSFTALRVGTSVAKGLCYALNIPLISISTLQLIAVMAKAKNESAEVLIPMIDARRAEVYTAIFDSNLKELSSAKAVVLDQKSFHEYADGRNIIICGDAAGKAKSLIGEERFKYYHVEPFAEHMIEQVSKKYIQKDFEPIAYYSPYYLKPPNITNPKKRLLK